VKIDPSWTFEHCVKNPKRVSILSSVDEGAYKRVVIRSERLIKEKWKTTKEKETVLDTVGYGNLLRRIEIQNSK